ncbi:MAG: UDP-4-amino-4,6-dideoxy-N-acetyl-beta-L-altrosamine transaminase [candidate division Zixibacteria bacterium]|nr:UDP-4-amino-4,6-dideoxy-N-acetyl-beta-L-altrosamine transaminase [candidate division Zixibacteria bacterium]
MSTSTQSHTGFLPYGKQHVSEADIEAVIKVLKSDWLTQGPGVPAFEKMLTEKVGASHTAVCSSGTAALHLTMLALGIGPGDEIAVSSNTFLASANCARFVGAEVRFIDINPYNGLIDLKSLSKVLQADDKHKIKAIIPVHFAGQPVELTAIHSLAVEHSAKVVEDACHAVGAWYEHDGHRHNIGGCSHSDMTVFSFHPVKHVAMGEGGAVTTNQPELIKRLQLFRNHGLQKEDFTNNDMARSPDGKVNPWYYEMHELGYNYRLTDIQAALGLSQLARLSWSLERRNKLADCYREVIDGTFPDGGIRPLDVRDSVFHAYHLFTVLIDFNRFGVSRADVMNRLRKAGIGTQVHYIPVPLQPYYRKRYGIKPGDFPGAEKYYARALSLPMYPDLTGADCEWVIGSLKTIMGTAL